MPKKFARPNQSSGSHRGIGILILAGGLIVLAAAFFALYYFVLRPQGSIEDLNIEKTTQAERTTTPQNEQTEAADTIENETPSALDIAREIAGENKASNTEESLATTTEMAAAETIATPTDQIVPAGTETASSAPATIAAITYGSDQDLDGLSDLEESIYGTNLAANDSDGDSYGDIAELANLYNPAGSGKIIVNPSIEKYTNSKHGYSLYYPKSWTINTAIGDDSIIFQIDSNQFIQIVFQTNAEKVNIEDWYRQQFSTDAITMEQKVYKKGWTGVKTMDAMTYYLTQPDSDKIFAISYSLGMSNVINYKNIFDMMVNSFEVVGP